MRAREDYCPGGSDSYNPLDVAREIEESARMKERARAPDGDALPKFEDARVQVVYELLCDNLEPPNREEHWEGWIARRIVAALSGAKQP